MDVWSAVLVVLLTFVGFIALQKWWDSNRPVPPIEDPLIGDLTLETLRYHNGYDYSKPILIAVRGKLYDVTDDSDIYGPGKPLNAYAGRECAKALALGSVKECDLHADLTSLTAEQLQELDAAVAKLESTHRVVGQVVPLKQLTLAELARHDGSDPDRPMYLAIKGLLFDITKGSRFYGPDGIYPFAGKECARAFALLSTEVKDCNDKLDDLSPSELSNLRDWEEKFHYKYPIIGNIIVEHAVPDDSHASAAPS